MVWFQCEDCGENLKKPKLPNHFRMCSATKLSCIDCGEMFGKQSVQSHTQCITEAEKYGPKGQAKASNGTYAKPNKDSNKQKLDIDITAGLSERAPWFCSLCNTKATSRQTLLLHAEGKKHRAKARAFHASKQPAKETEEATVDSKVSTENVSNGDLFDNGVEKSKAQDLAKVDIVHPNSETENGDLSLNKKRKADACENNGAKKTIRSDTEGENAENQGKKAKHNVVEEKKVPESSFTKDKSKKKIKWKRLIKSALKSSPDGVLKTKKLKKLVLKSLQDSGIIEDETKLGDLLENKIKSSSRFTHDNKHVRLVAKD